MDWKDALQQLKDSNPDMPEGADEPSAAEEQPASARPRIDVLFEKKGRGGKQATILCGMSPAMTDEEIGALASEIKRRLATGGSSRGGEILIQGDRRDDVIRLLVEMGYPRPRRVGG